MSESPIQRADRDLTPLALALVLLAALAAQAAALAALGQPAICPCGYVKIWHSPLTGEGNSQHLSDWWTYTHVVHGVAFYALLWGAAPALPLRARLALAVGIEVGWEILENTPLVVDRYRVSEHAESYLGDSIVNSLSDTIAAVAGFLLARFAPVRIVVVFVVALELLLALTIRDNLTLNIVQLVAPNETLSRWQAGG